MDITNLTFDERKDGFLKEFGELREKYQIDIMSVPQFIPTKGQEWSLVVQPQLVDLTKALTESPFHV